MFIEERHREILDLLRQNGRVSVAELQEKFNVSDDSARRDLRILEEKGLLKRTHGGAVPLLQVGVKPPRVRDMKNMEVFENYDAIAKRGASYIRENDVVYLTSGSVGFLMLKYLPADFPFKLVVNSVALADELKYRDNLEVYIVGGKMRMHGTASLVDSFAASFVRNMHFDLNLMTGAGIDAEFGFSNGTAETAAFQRAVITNSRRNVLLMPNQKVGFQAFLKVCDAGCFDTLVTDWDAVEDELAKIEELGVEVTVVEKKAE